MANEYELEGTSDFPQVDPDGSYWLRCRFLSNVPLRAVTDALEGGKVPDIDAYPEVGSEQEQEELEELRFMAAHAYEPDHFNEPLSAFLAEERYIRPEPYGAVLNQRGERPNTSRPYGVPGLPIIRTGAELARLFQAETPGLWHRHVLNTILDPRVEKGAGQKLGPVRQALIWSALDVAIVSALSAVWHYKWIATGLQRVARRRRPKEADPGLNVLYDTRVTFNVDGHIIKSAEPTPGPKPTPGTPRHPAYGSGHSTYSAAASHVLGCFFPEHKEDFRLLAQNIGHARLWGGVHWRSDHAVGRKIGETVGQLVIDQLNASGIVPVPDPVPSPAKLTREFLDKAGDKYAQSCGKARNDFCGGIVPKGSVVSNVL